MPYLARGTKLGMAKETTQYTYLPPTVSLPWKTAQFEDVIPPLRDESVRANDAVLQGVSQGPRHTTWDMDIDGAYPDLIGHFFAAMIGPDTVTAGVSTTLSAASTAGATSISATASIPAQSTIMIGTGMSVEYATTGTPSGAGPYIIPVTGAGTGGGLLYAHLANDPVVSQTQHQFAQARTFATVWPTYSFTADDGATQTGWPGCVCNELAIKIDPKGFVSIAPKYIGMPSTTEATFAYAASDAQPVVGWGWTVTNAGAASNRGLTMDLTLKRAVEPIPASTGTQAPRDIFPGALECDGTYKTIFENSTDMNLFEQALQEPTVHTLTQPIYQGGAVLVITMSQSAYTTGKRDLAQPYVQAEYALSAVNNATDGGLLTVSLSNFQTTSY